MITWRDTDTRETVCEYEGCVLCTRERNGPDDSDFYAVVWDEQEQGLKAIEYATTRFASTGSARVDATPEVIVKAETWLRKWLEVRIAEEDVRFSQQIVESREVVVVRGRKIPLGSQGRVFLLHDGKWGRSALVEPAHGEKFWCAVRNLEVFQPEHYRMDDETVKALAAHQAKQHLWHLPFAGRSYITI